MFGGDLVGITRVQSWSGEAPRRIFATVSDASGGWQFVLLVLATAAALFALRRRLESLFLVLSGASGLVSIFLKRLIERPRPFTGVTAAGGSFPSNHVVVYTVFGGFLLWLLLRSGLPLALKLSGGAVLVAVLGLIDLSRIYGGAHWPSDVYGGTIIGLFLLSLLLLTYLSAQRSLAHEA